MKYTIEGLQQDKLVEWGLDGNDAIIIRYVIDFWNTQKMVMITHDGETFFWLNYKHLLENLPILQIKSKDSIRRRFSKYENCGLMKHYCKKEQGSFSCYKFTEKLDELIYKNTSKKTCSEPPLTGNPLTAKPDANDSEAGGGTTLKSDGYDSKVGTKDYSINNYSINNIKSDNSENTNEGNNCHPTTGKKIPEEITSLTVYFINLIKENVCPPTFRNRPPKLAKWAEDIEKLHRIDGASLEDIKKVMTWTVKDDFWSTNILSGAKLRKHYNRLYLEMNRNKQPTIDDIYPMNTNR